MWVYACINVYDSCLWFSVVMCWRLIWGVSILAWNHTLIFFYFIPDQGPLYQYRLQDYPLSKHLTQLCWGKPDAFPGLGSFCGVSTVGHALNISEKSCPRDVQKKSKTPTRLFSMWRRSSYSLSLSQMTDLATLSLREGPATLPRKLILAAYIQDLVISLMIQIFMTKDENRNVRLLPVC